MPNKEAARSLLHAHVQDPYQRIHAEMVGQAMEGYASLYGENEQLWWLTGYLHDLDYDEHPTEHPGPSLSWFKAWGYPPELIHAVEAHANGFNGFTVKPETLIARMLIACDEISGIFYAYQKINPIGYGAMKVSSIQKRIKERRFAPGIDREHINAACESIGMPLEMHITHLRDFFAQLDVA